MSENSVMQDNIGILFELEIIDTLTDLAYDLTGFSTLQMIFRKPSGAIVTQTATAPTPSNGKIQYTTVASDLDEAGNWKVQGRVSDGSVDAKTSIYEFRVIENLS